jgi:hypothetical protein
VLISVHPSALAYRDFYGHRQVMAARREWHLAAVKQIHRVHAASLRAVARWSRESGHDEKQDPNPLAEGFGSNRSTSDATDERAACGQHGRGR